MEILPCSNKRLIRNIPNTNAYIISHPSQPDKGWLETNQEDGYYGAWAILIFNVLFGFNTNPNDGIEII